MTEYEIQDTNLLVDLNKGMINYRINFRIRSANGEPFKSTVVSQKEIDSSEPLKYNIVDNGVLEGDIENVDNVYEPQYLILRTVGEEKVKVYIDINRDEIPLINKPNASSSTSSTKESKNYLFTLIIVLVLILLVAGGVYYFHDKEFGIPLIFGEKLDSSNLLKRLENMEF